MSYLTIERRNSTAVIWLDQPGEKVNTLNNLLVEEFEGKLSELEQDADIKSIVLMSRKEDTFIAGADLEMLKTMEKPEDVEAFNRDGNIILNQIASFRKPVVAAIHGAALGGGLEVALASHYRIATDHPKTKFALPEVQLGLLPGGGGTQRLPRLVGLQKALDMTLTGRNIYPRQAKRMGLIDELIHKDALLDAALKIAENLALGKLKPKRNPLSLMDKILEKNPVGRNIIYSKAKESVLKRTQGNYPAPLKILDCVRTGMESGFEKGREKELRHFTDLVFSKEAKELINLFFAMQKAKKNPYADQVSEVKKIGVLGAGLMGSGIAEVSIDHAKKNVVIKDRDLDAAGIGLKTIWKDLDYKTKKHIISPFQRDQTFSNITAAQNYEDLRRADLIIEAVFEDLKIKQDVLSEVEKVVSNDCIFASNTSSLPITKIAAKAKHPENIVGMHYFSPVPKMPLLEVIRTKSSSERAVATAYDIGLKQGKTVILVNDGPGFYTTRILAPYINEAVTLLEEKAAIEDIDRAMKKFGFPVGPIKLMDEVGIDVGAHVTEVLSGVFEKRGIKGSKAANQLLNAGFKGKKNQKGFYNYSGSKKKRKEVNKEVYAFFGGSDRRKLDFPQIQDRISLIMINEAVYCLQEGILNRPEDGDLGAILGLGFPPFLGGPFRYIDHYGLNELLRKFETLQEQYGERFRPAPLLSDYAKNGKKFYAE